MDDYSKMADTMFGAIPRSPMAQVNGGNGGNSDEPHNLAWRLKNPLNRCNDDNCPIEASPYAYHLNAYANYIPVALFVISLLVFFIQGIIYRKKTVSFTLVMMLGTGMEAIGYVGRVFMVSNPFNKLGIQIQLILLTVAPAFLSAGIYFTLKHIVIAFGTRYSRLRPAAYTWIFIICDIVSILMQAAGGALAAMAQAENDQDKGQTASDIVLAGVIIQVVTLSIFALLSLDFWIRTARNKAGARKSASAHLTRSMKFRFFILALMISFIAIYIRCVYRIAEMAGGIKSDIAKDQPLFIICETIMILISVIVLNIFHPGYCFTRPAAKLNAIAEVKEAPNDSEEDEWDYRPRGPSMYPRPTVSAPQQAPYGQYAPQPQYTFNNTPQGSSHSTKPFDNNAQVAQGLSQAVNNASGGGGYGGKI